MRLLTDNPWAAITAAVRKCPGKCRVAVAYFGRGAAQLLPLRRGSVLVLDFSEAAVRSGHACPDEVLRLLKHGVEVHSVTNLHAKVFVVGRSVFIGSTNVSRSSALTLVEAVVHGADRALVRQSVEFVDSLVGEHVTPEHARQMTKLYRPPQFAVGGPATRRPRKVAPGHGRTWVVQLYVSPWDAADDTAAEQGRPVAQRRLKAPSRFRLYEFCCTSPEFARRVKPGDQVVQVLEESPRRVLVSPPERVLHLENYQGARRRQSSIVYLETPKNLRRKTLARVRKALGRPASQLRPKSPLSLLKDAALVHRLHQLWPTLS